MGTYYHLDTDDFEGNSILFPCPLKKGFFCAATPALILESRCIGCEYKNAILNNPWDAFGRAYGFTLDTLFTETSGSQKNDTAQHTPIITVGNDILNENGSEVANCEVVPFFVAVRGGYGGGQNGSI